MSESDSEDDEYVYYGTPLVAERAVPYYADPSGSSDPSKTIALPVHQQQVRDAQGRQRLHGAFEGGFSAGFFNTVGSLEGFKPAAFRSSRSDRGVSKEQQYTDFLDEDELEQLERKGLRAAPDYDTFGDQAHAAAAKQLQTSDRQRLAAGAPSLFPDELLRPVADSIGIQLLQKMGWRQGHGLGSHEVATLQQMGYQLEPQAASAPAPKARKWGPQAGLRAENTPIHRLVPKRDLYGLGYDPYKDAAEIRELRKRGREATQPESGKRHRGVAFAPSVLEESDVYGGELADYVDDSELRSGYANEIVSDESDDDAPGGAVAQQQRIGGRDPHLALKARAGTMGRDSFIDGFVRGELETPPRMFPSPTLPPGFRARQHVFEQACALLYGAAREGRTAQGTMSQQTAPEPPTDAALKHRIDVMAAAVARGGAPIEALAQRQHEGNQDYDFLEGGLGTAYYQHRVAHIRALLVRAGAVLADPAVPSHGSRHRLTVDQRAAALGEQALQGNRAPGVSARAALHDVAAESPAKLARPGHQHSASGTTQPAVARGTGLLARVAAADIAAVSASFNSRFVKAGTMKPDAGGWTTAAETKAAEVAELPKAVVAVRTQQDWHPEPLLCRRFNVPDPYSGKAARLQPPKHRIDYLALPETARAEAYAASLPDFMKPPQEPPAALPPPPPRRAAGGAEDSTVGSSALPPPPARKGAAATPALASGGADETDAADALLAELDAERAGAGAPVSEAANAPPMEALPVDKPLDIFKAIFENSDDEGSESGGDGNDPQPNPAGGGPHDRQAGDGAAAAGGVAAAGQTADMSSGGGPGKAGHTDLAAALMRAQTEMARQAAAAQSRHRNDAGKTQETRPPPVVSSDEGPVGSGSEGSDSESAGDVRRRAADDAGEGSRPKGSGRRKRSRQELLEEALATVRSDVTRQAMSTEQIHDLVRSLKKEKRKHKHRKGKDKHKKHKRSRKEDKSHRQR